MVPNNLQRYVFNSTASKRSQWREAFLAAGQAGLRSSGSEGPSAQLEKLQAKVGELTMANDLLEHKIEHLERGRSLPARRSKP